MLVYQRVTKLFGESDMDSAELHPPAAADRLARPLVPAGGQRKMFRHGSIWLNSDY
jgi:hypothetical protein